MASWGKNSLSHLQEPISSLGKGGWSFKKMASGKTPHYDSYFASPFFGLSKLSQTVCWCSCIHPNFHADTPWLHAVTTLQFFFRRQHYYSFKISNCRGTFWKVRWLGVILQRVCTCTSEFIGQKLRYVNDYDGYLNHKLYFLSLLVVSIIVRLRLSF